MQLNQKQAKTLRAYAQSVFQLCLFLFLEYKLMRTIDLTQNQVALVDDEDFEWVNQWKWYAMWQQGTQSFIAARSIRNSNTKKRRTIRMAREICGLKYGDKRVSDHKNHDTLDNQRYNLRKCTHQQNLQNHRKNRTYNGKKCSSRYSGVAWHAFAKKWVVWIENNNKKIYLGLFTSEIEAAKKYDGKAKELFKEFANLNFG